MRQLFSVLGALALGAGAMYYLDPQQGRRRRALVGDKVDSISHDARDYVQSRSKRAGDRVRGMVARTRSRIAHRQPTDGQLYGQVRSRLGRTVSYPHAIETDVRDGGVLLRGDVLEREFNTLMAELWSIPGVKSVENHLSLHAECGNVPALQGRPRRTRARTRYIARNTAAILAVAGGVGAALQALRARDGHSHVGLLSLAITLLAYGMGDGAQRLVRLRRSRPFFLKERDQAAQARPEGSLPEAPAERPEEQTPALLNPSSAWH